MTMTMTLQDRRMVDTEYSSDNNGADPAFTNYTRHSHIAPRFTVMMIIMMMNMQKLMSHCWIDFVHKCKSLAILLSVCNVSQQFQYRIALHIKCRFHAILWKYVGEHLPLWEAHGKVGLGELICLQPIFPFACCVFLSLQQHVCLSKTANCVTVCLSLCVSLLQIVVSSPPSASDNMCPPHPTLFAAHLVVSLAE